MTFTDKDGNALKAENMKEAQLEAFRALTKKDPHAVATVVLDEKGARHFRMFASIEPKPVDKA